jgi:hypothetical protein
MDSASNEMHLLGVIISVSFSVSVKFIHMFYKASHTILWLPVTISSTVFCPVSIVQDNLKKKVFRCLSNVGL